MIRFCAKEMNLFAQVVMGMFAEVYSKEIAVVTVVSGWIGAKND